MPDLTVRVVQVLLLIGSVAGRVAGGGEFDEVRRWIENGQAARAVDVLANEVEKNPAHESARVLLARALEAAGRKDDALGTWQELLALSYHPRTQRDARRAISRLKRETLDDQPCAGGVGADGADPFDIKMPPITWQGLEVIEDAQYRSPILPPPYNLSVPPFAQETGHFTVFSTNERLSQVIGERAEIFLDFMTSRLFGGRSWAVRIPILVYVDYNDYRFHGGPAGSGGATLGHITGRTQAILLYQLGDDGRVWKYGIESVLPHELTHAVINEFFEGRRPPQWLHEAVAGRFEQTRDHYGEAARLGRHVEAGEYFRMRDLFEQQSYPERIELFYEQSAAVVLYLFETGPDAMRAFLTELKDGNGHDAACAAALGIDEARAVEHFEQRWVAWVKRCYDAHRDGMNHGQVPVGAARLTRGAQVVPADEIAAVDVAREWRTLDLSASGELSRWASDAQGWEAADGRLRSSIVQRGSSAVLPLSVAERPPVAVRCEVAWQGRPDDGTNWFGFAQLDADGNDLPVTVAAPFVDFVPHELVCVWADDLAVYIDGRCAGRYPATHVTGDAPDIDRPLGLVAYGPFEIRSVKVSRIAPVAPGSVPTSKRWEPRPENHRGRKRTRSP